MILEPGVAFVEDRPPLPLDAAPSETSKLSAKAGKIWMEYGALQYVECVGDDLKIKGMSSSFPKQLKVKPGETVVFSWIAYKSKAQRNAGVLLHESILPALRPWTQKYGVPSP